MKAKRSQVHRTVILIISVCLISFPAQAKYGGGSGTVGDPYLIYTAEQMNAIGANPDDFDKHFKLMSDIDLSSYTGTDFNIIGDWSNAFIGVFDGNGHTISNFTYTSTDRDYIGLFGCIGSRWVFGSWVEKCEIKDLGLINPNVDAGTGFFGNDSVGSLLGDLADGTITNCYVEGGSVAGSFWVGGLVGNKWDGEIINCYSTSSVSGTDYVGGLVGDNWGTITNCYANGSVSGNEDVGGLVGQNGYLSSDTITNCYSTGSVSGDFSVGGLVGRNDEGGSITSSFWNMETSSQATSAGGTGKTTVEMQMASTFIDAGWDFVDETANGTEDIWWILEGQDYPRLWRENEPGEAPDIQQLSDFLTGAGTQDDPYLIYTAEQMNEIGQYEEDWDKHFKLMADIDLSGYTETDFNIIGIDWDNAFTGVFDGNSHTISNFSYISTATNHIGLFRYVGGVIKDLGLINPNVDSGTGDYVGSLVGSLSSGAITNCYASGDIAGDNHVGGLVGLNSYDGTITDCYATASVSGSGSKVGGLVGQNHDATINNCYSTGTVSGATSVGGLVGLNDFRGTITGSYATGDVLAYGPSGWHGAGGGGLVGTDWYTITNCYATGSVSGKMWVGGLVGTTGGTITNCYATGTVSGDEWVGGLVGENYYGTIINCYSLGGVMGTTAVGGLVGYNWRDARITSSFWDVQTSGLTNMCGLQADEATGCDDSFGKTTTEMKTASTFLDAGWDFVAESVNGTEDIWSICEGVYYPRLTWQFVIGDFDGDAEVVFADFAIFAAHWLGTDRSFFCGDGGTDLTNDGKVEFNDLREFSENWLQPQLPVPPHVPEPPQPPPGPKGRLCFTAETPVWVDGVLVQISEVARGQTVGKLLCAVPTPCLEQVEQVQEHEGTFECRDVVLESGNRIGVVDAHCFMLDSGQWIAAQNLASGLRLKTLTGTVGIKSVTTRAVPYTGKVYNLKVTGVDRYLVSEDAVIVRDY